MIGPAGATFVIIGAPFSMFGNISGMVLNMPRVLFAAARDNVIPLRDLQKYIRNFLLLIIQSSLMPAWDFFLPLGEFKQLAMLSSASYLLIYLGVVLSLIKFRISRLRRRFIYNSGRISNSGVVCHGDYMGIIKSSFERAVGNGDIHLITYCDLFHNKIS